MKMTDATDVLHQDDYTGVLYYRIPYSTGFKSLHAIAWWISYANETAERLPDQDFLLTPPRYKARCWQT